MQKAAAMAVFGAMWSFSGKGNKCYASIGLGPDDELNPKIKKATLCSRSGLSKNTVVKYKKLLYELGWIVPKREGRGYNDTIELFAFAQMKIEIQNPNFHDSKSSNPSIEVFQNPNTSEEVSSGVPQESVTVVQNLSTENIKIMDDHNVEIDVRKKEIPEVPIWKDFLGWSSERLTRSSCEILNHTRVELIGGSLVLLNPVPESLMMIIGKFFMEESKIKVPVIFSKEKSEDRKIAA
ncbi:helix-turn-helix domain-containing protein [Leptospira stimsonii]|nr:helix-turn-helix domain-containing protein [Leptospira stimsonii]